FTGKHDADVMHNSALINLNVLYYGNKYNIKKIFYSSSACIYPSHNQTDPNNPKCNEESAYPACPDSEYGWEKLFSERMYRSFHRNYDMNIRIARFHNIFGEEGSWNNGKEKSPAAICRKVAECKSGNIEIWGTGEQTRSFLYIDECLKGIKLLMNSYHTSPINIGSEEVISINNLAKMVIDISGKDIKINNLFGKEYAAKYGCECPIGVMGRNSDNKNLNKYLEWTPSQTLKVGMEKLYKWINKQVQNG
ncbi:unnamed protein product, partial [marine sediment metagenome]